MRIGFGYDIHRVVVGRPLVLGGVNVPWDHGLVGHSDADVVLHALMDAMLGAAHLGDIGRHFPPSDERYRGVSSIELLATVADLVESAGFRMLNADITVVAEAPRLAPHVVEMEARVAGTLRLSPAVISIKATTNEGVGPEGNGEAISAHAVTLLEELG